MANRKIIILSKCLISALFVSFCIPADSLDIFMAAIKNRSNLDIHYFWMNSIIYGGIYGYYFIYILAGMPYADSFCCEYCQGIWRYLIMRMGTKKYAVRKFIIAICLGGLTASGGGLLFITVLKSVLPLFQSGRAIEVTFLPCSEILIKNPEKYFLIMLYIMLLAGGMWTTISVCISAYCPVNYFVHLIPFIGIFLLTRFNSMLHLPDKWRLDFWLCGRAGLEQPYVYILLLTVSVTVLTSICCWLFYKKVKWRVLNE